MTIAEAAAQSYRANARRILTLAAQEAARGHALTARLYRYRASIAEAAAEAELRPRVRLGRVSHYDVPR
jgi:hypothetical protein